MDDDGKRSTRSKRLTRLLDVGPTSSVAQRLLDTHAEIMGEPDARELAFLHTILAQVSLPYREPKGRDYIRQSGRASLIVSAGHLMDPHTRRPVLQGVPYGAKPRLLMLHLCTQAVRLRSATIPIADSMSAFMGELGLAVTGGATGTIGRFKEQLNRLAAARLQLMFDLENRGVTLNPAPMVKSFDVWFPPDHRQRVLWPSEVILSEEFFTSLQDHALPLDPRAVQALHNTARGLDLYTWLALRLPNVKGRSGDFVSWIALQHQFGPDIIDAKTFRRECSAALSRVLVVYPGAKVGQVEGGLRLFRSAPPIRDRRLNGPSRVAIS